MARSFPKLRLFSIVAVLGINCNERMGVHSFRSIIVQQLPIDQLQQKQLPRLRRKFASNDIFLRRRRGLHLLCNSVTSSDIGLELHKVDDDDDFNDNVATLRSVTFSHLPKDQEPNLLCELLMEYGACASWITDADRYTELEEPIFHEPPTLPNSVINNNNSNNNNTIEDMLSIPWITPVWNQCNVTALFPASIHIPTTIAAIREIYTDIVAIVIDDENMSTNEVVEIGTSDDNQNDSNDILLAEQSSLSPLSSSSSSELLGSYSVETVPNNKDWVLSVQQSWHPIIINDCFILRFPWHTDHDVTMAIHQHYSNQNGNLNATGNHQKLLIQQENEQLIPILLQGGIAFGTGEHATTQLCLQWLHDTVTQTLLAHQSQHDKTQPSIRVLDYGTGSGILGIAACAIGQKEQRRRMELTTDNNIDDWSPLVTAIGIDIDIDACQIANANAILNGNVSMKSYLPSFHNNNDNNSMHDDESQSLLMKAHYNYQQQQQSAITDPYTGVAMDDIVLSDPSVILADESFDVCVANILAGPLIVLASTLYNYLRPGGWIGMSGILSHQDAMVIEAYQNVGFINVQVHDTMNGWVLVTGQRPPVL